MFCGSVLRKSKIFSGDHLLRVAGETPSCALRGEMGIWGDMPPQLLGIVVFTSLVECWTPLCGNYPQIEVIKPHGALLSPIKGC